MSKWPRQAGMNAFYGNPDTNSDGMPDAAWEAQHLVSLKPPYRMVAAWAPDREIRTIRVHRKCAPSLSLVLEGIARHYGSQQAIETARMHLYGGCYNFRMMRGGSRLSIHSWGAAIDLDPANNPLGMRYREGGGMMPPAVVALFASEGWTWGGEWSRPDAMHFQAADI